MQAESVKTRHHRMIRRREGRVVLAQLEALAVDDGGAGLVVFGLGDPHRLEGREGGEDG
eukprot:CAMPEP_0118895428 /NCGR_PEP_ID=MMETSP1166-20130328/3786_1 /TAXON_ID=1104430 /ORGANISM="Chrysoreinhardia sp, Strain CCMP3193" /LENGTH=58 /DNA_ID=CAMNT_0006834453 /DNA_START=90 /DNA_END=263 /DNA_ORIENTATION=+